MTERTINWDRAIFIDSPIDDEFVRRITPTILKLRQDEKSPITLGIDSPGGNLGSLDTLLSLLQGPSQSGARGKIITVSTNRAYSAAANLLAFGDYSIALEHSQILFHDVRYGGMVDVTPAKARDAAKSLQDANDTFALKLANEIISRLLWVYIGLSSEFDEINSKYPGKFSGYQKILDSFSPRIDGLNYVDVASFATSLWAKTSLQNDNLIEKVMDRLQRWIVLTNLSKSVPTFREKGSRKPGILDGAASVYKKFSKKTESIDNFSEALKTLLTLLIAESAYSNATNENFAITLEQATRDFNLIQSMEDKKHKKSALRLMYKFPTIFFGIATADEIKNKSDEEKEVVISAAAPSAQLFWLFCISLCSELFEGEHILSAHDAQLLGIVDEVAGGGPVISRREFNDKKTTEETAPQP